MLPGGMRHAKHAREACKQHQAEKQTDTSGVRRQLWRMCAVQPISAEGPNFWESSLWHDSLSSISSSPSVKSRALRSLH